MSRAIDANLDLAFVENAPGFVSPNIGGARVPLGHPPLRPPCQPPPHLLDSGATCASESEPILFYFHSPPAREYSHT